MHPRPTLEAFDRFLAERSLQLDAIIIGGAALGLLGITDRQTRDVDVLTPTLSAEVTAAAIEFAAMIRKIDVQLSDDWLNNGPAQVTLLLPDAWRERLQPAYDGIALQLLTLGRADLLKTKLFALCDRAIDLLDCVALDPSGTELDEAEPWLAKQDAHPGWPNHVTETLNDLRRRLGHGV